MRYRGRIKELNHIVVSDPTYDKDVWCRYEKSNINEKNWGVDIDIHPVETPINDEISIKGTEFYVFLYKDKKICELREEGTIRYFKGIELKETDIGMDTACVALGVNDKAKEINDSQDDWKPEFALNTLTDGIFGTVKEGVTKGNQTMFIWISGYLDEDTGYTMDEIIEYLKEQLNIAELEKDIQRPYIIKQQNLIEKMRDITLKFREITKEDPKLLEFFNKDNRFSNITFAGTHLAAIKVRNEQRQAKELDGKMEESPYSKEQEKLIEEYKELQNEFERTEKEFENNIDMEV